MNDGMGGGVVLRTFAFIDRMQPQYAALTGTVIKGDVPVAGMAELYVELAPGSEAFGMINVAVKATDARPGFQIVEREFGMVELHSPSVESIREAGRAMLAAYGLQESDRVKPAVVSSKIISNVNAYQAQLINRFRHGSLLVPSETLFIMECEPAGYIVIAANEAEKAANIKLVDFDPVGRYGRLYISGSESEVRAACDAAIGAIRAIKGKQMQG
ncbi:MAG: BMC domain-containing protein [Bacillota bacterium]